MIENLENTLQLAVLLCCTAVATVRAAAFKSRTWTLLALFFGSWVLGDCYWLCCAVFFGETPRIPLISDLSWYAGCIFLYTLLRQVSPPKTRAERRLLPWLGPVFTAAMAVFYLQWGQLFSNLVYASLMGLLLFSSIRRLMDADPACSHRMLCAAILIFCFLEYGMWTASCIWEGDTLRNPYFWFEFAQTVFFPFLLPATKKAVTA